MRFNFALSFAVGALVLIGCSGSSSTSAASKLANLDIVDAKALFIASGSGTASSNIKTQALVSAQTTASPGLYKITADNQVLQVSETCTDSKGNVAQCDTTLGAQAIYNAGPNFVYISFGSEDVLVRKSDGAVFLTTDLGVPVTPINLGVLLGNTPIQSDSAGNLYFAGSMCSGSGSCNSGVIKLDTHDPASISAGIITPVGESVQLFLVDGAGNVWYAPITGGSNKIRFTGGSYAYASFGNPNVAPWVGLDGVFTGFVHDFATSTSRLNRFIIDGTTITQEPHAIVSDMNCQLCGLDDSLLTIGNTLMLGEPAGTVVELADPDNLVFHDGTCMGSLRSASPLAIWYMKADPSGGTSLGRWTPSSDNCSQLVPAVEYDVLSFTVGVDDVAQFTATRMSDGAKVLAEIDASGTVTPLNVSTLGTVIDLERIR
jgi:hypothetical protein